MRMKGREFPLTEYYSIKGAMCINGVGLMLGEQKVPLDQHPQEYNFNFSCGL